MLLCNQFYWLKFEVEVLSFFFAFFEHFVKSLISNEQNQKLIQHYISQLNWPTKAEIQMQCYYSLDLIEFNRNSKIHIHKCLNRQISFDATISFTSQKENVMFGFLYRFNDYCGRLGIHVICIPLPYFDYAFLICAKQFDMLFINISIDFVIIFFKNHN